MIGSHHTCPSECNQAQIGCIASSKERIVCGVPQGSVLGRLLFLIYVNDMHRSSKKFDFYLFADDTNLLYAEKDLNKLEVVVNEELLKLCEWLNSNKLSLNVSKSNFVIFHKLYREVNLKILDNNSEQLVFLERKTDVKYLFFSVCPYEPLSLTSRSRQMQLPLWAMVLFLNPTGFPVPGQLHKVRYL